MTFRVRKYSTVTEVWKRVPIRGRRHTFTYRFVHEGMNALEIELGIAECKRVIAADIRQALVAAGVRPLPKLRPDRRRSESSS